MTKTGKTLDLSSLDTATASNKGFELELKHPVTGEALGQFVSVLGKDSDVFRNYVRQQTNEQLRKNAVNKKRGKEDELPTLDQIDNKAIGLLAECTIGFRDINYKGEALVFSKENAIKLYTEQLWIRRQVDEAIADLELFFPE